jgi:hypothetical protein
VCEIPVFRASAVSGLNCDFCPEKLSEALTSCQKARGKLRKLMKALGKLRKAQESSQKLQEALRSLWKL